MNTNKNGPFELDESEDESELYLEFRNYECDCYKTCLGIAAGLNWDDFSCRGCCGEVDQSLLWQVRQEQRKDGLVKKLCSVPGAACFESEERTPNEVPALKLVKSVGNKK